MKHKDMVQLPNEMNKEEHNNEVRSYGKPEKNNQNKDEKQRRANSHRIVF
jgi:hypothetical protein